MLLLTPSVIPEPLRQDHPGASKECIHGAMIATIAPGQAANAYERGNVVDLWVLLAGPETLDLRDDRIHSDCP
jgi:hypothetical protein